MQIRTTLSSILLLDVAPSGRMLVANAAVRREIIGRAPGAAAEMNLSWQDWSAPSAISGDGRFAAFEEGNNVNANGYAIFLRGTDGGPPLQLGYGSVVALSPDGNMLAVVRRASADDRTLVLVPRGLGEPRTVPLDGLRLSNQGGRWLRYRQEGEFIITSARRDDGNLRIYRIPLDGTSPAVAITPDDFSLAAHGHVFSPDGRQIVVRPTTGAPVAFTADGEGPQPLAGVLPTDLPVGLDRDGRHLYVQETQAIPSPIYRVDLVTGVRELHAELSPGDPAGVAAIDRVRISDDGEAYVYSIRRIISDLKVVDGLQ